MSDTKLSNDQAFPSGPDVQGAITRGLLGSIPYVGAALTEAANFFQTRMQKRQVDWLNDLATQVQVLLSEERLKLSDLVDNEAFIDATARAFPAAMRTAQEEKRRL